VTSELNEAAPIDYFHNHRSSGTAGGKDFCSGKPEGYIYAREITSFKNQNMATLIVTCLSVLVILISARSIH
jgi:hypothetical protein